MIGEGEKVVLLSTLRGTHTGEFMGMPPTGKPVVVVGIDIVRIENGKMAEHWGLFDAAGLMMQIGAMPPPGQPPK